MNALLQLKDKQIVVLGLGLTGMSFVRFLHAQSLAFAVNDSRENIVDKQIFTQDYPTASLVQGHWDAKLIEQADILLVSPGIDINNPAIKAHIPPQCQVWGDVELYCRLNSTPIVAVTGSNGKSTVVHLVDHIGKSLGFDTQLCGNVGVPILDTMNQPTDLLVLELSSFQLETMTSMQAIAGTMLNLSDDHLDRHLTIENYKNIKQKIYHQCETAICNRDDADTCPSIHDVHSKSPSSVHTFGTDKPEMGEFGLDNCQDETWLFYGVTPLIPISQLPLAGVHNALNCLAALALGHCAGWPIDKMVETLGSFKGLEHRCQRVDSEDGLVWINDSKATNVGATIAAINGMAPLLTDEKRLILIAGGDGKGADFSPLDKAFAENVDFVIGLGKDAEKITAIHDKARIVTTIEDAVAVAKTVACHGDIVLLSPACASIDMFKNFAERGDRFMKAVLSTEAS